MNVTHLSVYILEPKDVFTIRENPFESLRTDGYTDKLIFRDSSIEYNPPECVYFRTHGRVFKEGESV